MFRCSEPRTCILMPQKRLRGRIAARRSLGQRNTRGEQIDTEEGCLIFFQPFTITQGARCKMGQARSGLHEQTLCPKGDLCSVSMMLYFSKHICSL